MQMQTIIVLGVSIMVNIFMFYSNIILTDTIKTLRKELIDLKLKR